MLQEKIIFFKRVNGKCQLITVLAVLMCGASASAFYEDFATTPDQYTLYGSASVTGGHLEGTAGWGQGALFDPTFATPTPANPLVYTLTFNMGGMDDYASAAPLVGFGSSGAGGFLGQANGFMLLYMPLYHGGPTFNLLYNPGSGVWTDIHWNPDPNEGIPGGLDLNADYELLSLIHI